MEVVSSERGMFIPGVSALLGLNALWPLTHTMADNLVGARQLYWCPKELIYYSTEEGRQLFVFELII